MKLINLIISILAGVIFCGFILSPVFGAAPTPAPAPQPGAIRGKVYDAATGKGLSGVTLRAFDLNGDPAYKGGTRTGSGGSYILDQLQTGFYTLRADPGSIPGGSNYAVQYYNRKYSKDTADWIPTNSSGIDFPLAPPQQGWAIKGRVYDSVTGAGLAGILVTATGSLGHADAISDRLGNYEIAGLPVSWSGNTDTQYLVWAKTGYMIDQAVYVQQYYNQQSVFDLATWVSESAAGIDFPLRKGGVVTGTIRDEDTGTGIPDITVTVYDQDYTAISFQRTDENGFYSIRPFLTGDYRLYANTDYFHSQHSPQCYFNRWYERETNFY